MARIASLTWQPYNKDKKSYVALVSANVSLNSIYQIVISGNIDNEPSNVRPAYLLVDNLLNAGQVLVSFGPFAINVPQFGRETFQLPPSLSEIVITGSIGTVGLMFSTEVLGPDALNQLLAVEASGGGFQMPTAIMLGDTKQSPIFNAYNLIGAVRLKYTLLAANAVPNGFIQWIDCFAGIFIEVIPLGADTINGVFTAASHMFLQPGNGGYIVSNGIDTWTYCGSIGEFFNLGAGLITAATLSLNLGPSGWLRFPYDRYATLNNVTADANYIAGDQILLNQLQQGTVNRKMIIFQTAPDAEKAVMNAIAPIVPNATTGATTVITLARWGWGFGSDINF